MKFGIIGAMQTEVALIKENMDNIKEHNFKGLTYFTGTYKENDVVVGCCGIGKINSAIYTQIIIDKFDVDCVINTGIAGAISEKVKVFDVVVSSEACFHDIDASLFKRFPPYETDFKADKKLIDDAVKSCECVSGGKFNIYIGKIASGDQYIADNNIKKQIKEKHSPMCVEMEGASIAEVCFINETPFVIIRTMSDCADDVSEETYDNFADITAKNSASIVLNMIENYR